MKCSFSRLLYPKRLEEARDGSYMIALFRPNEKILDAQGNRLNSIKVVGHFLPTVASVKVDMTGHWKKDARYGLQFEMESYEEIVGSDKSSVVAYLSSGMIPGIGSVLAERIYNTFGEQTLEVLDQDPTRVAEVPGINKKKCDQFCTAYMETRSARKLITVRSTPTDEQTFAKIQSMIDAVLESLKDNMKYQIEQENRSGQEEPTGPNQQDLDDMLDNLTIFDQ